jgi:hypothetical protein
MTNTYPFRRLAVCDRCSARMYGEPHGHGKPGEPPVLSMGCITQRERHTCDQTAVRSSVLEGQVGDWLASLSLPPDWRGDMERLQRGIAVADDRPPADVAKVERQLDRLQDLYSLGDLTREEYVSKSRALRASLEVGRPQPVYPQDALARAAGCSKTSARCGNRRPRRSAPPSLAPCSPRSGSAITPSSRSPRRTLCSCL